MRAVIDRDFIDPDSLSDEIDSFIPKAFLNQDGKPFIEPIVYMGVAAKEKGKSKEQFKIGRTYEKQRVVSFYRENKMPWVDGQLPNEWVKNITLKKAIEEFNNKNVQSESTSLLAENIDTSVLEDSILGGIFRNPIIMWDGYTYEREVLDQVLKNSNVSPHIRMQFSDEQKNTRIVNLTLKDGIKEWLKKNKEWKKQVYKRNTVKMTLEGKIPSLQDKLMTLIPHKKNVLTWILLSPSVYLSYQMLIALLQSDVEDCYNKNYPDRLYHYCNNLSNNHTIPVGSLSTEVANESIKIWSYVLSSLVIPFRSILLQLIYSTHFKGGLYPWAHFPGKFKKFAVTLICSVVELVFEVLPSVFIRDVTIHAIENRIIDNGAAFCAHDPIVCEEIISKNVTSTAKRCGQYFQDMWNPFAYFGLMFGLFVLIEIGMLLYGYLSRSRSTSNATNNPNTLFSRRFTSRNAHAITGEFFGADGNIDTDIDDNEQDIFRV